MTSKEIHAMIMERKRPNQTVFITTQVAAYNIHLEGSHGFVVRLSILPWQDKDCNQWECQSVQDALDKLQELNNVALVEQEVPCA